MRRRLIIGCLFLAALALAVLHDAALRLSWYYFYPLIDIPIHVLGGFVVSFFTYIFLSSFNIFAARHSSSLRQLFLLLGATFCVSIIWEVFELVFYLTNDAGLSLNTSSDIFFGLIGGVLGWGLIQLLPSSQ